MFVFVVIIFSSFWLMEATNTRKQFVNINSPSCFADKVLESLPLLQADISPECDHQMVYYAETLLSDSKALWALKMFDAGSKIPSGIFTGNFVDLGFFEECIDTYDNATTEVIFGKYCIGVLSSTSLLDSYKLQPEIKLQISTCLPSACSADDIEKIYEKLYIPIKFDEVLCQTKINQIELDSGDIFMISFLAVVFGIILCSTIYDIIIIYFKKNPIHQLSLAFSILANGKNLIETTNKPNQISCIHGIRVLSMMWILLGHKYVIATYLPVRNYLHFLEFIEEQANMFIFNKHLAVDTFLVVGGIVLVYTFMGSMDNGNKFNIVSYYIHRYLRLTPLLAVTIGIYVTILKHFGSGPVWPVSLSLLVNPCKQYWYLALLYVQNFFLVGSEMCMAQTWYLSVDFQLILISPILFLPLKRWPRITLTMIGVLVLCSSLATFLTSWFLEITMSIFINFDADKFCNYKKYFYYATWIRGSSWLIGIIVGYLIFKFKQKQFEFTINKIIALILWITSLVILYVCVFEGYDLRIGKSNQLTNAFHMALVRPSWAIAISWIILACVTGYGGPVNEFLSLPIFQIISKLTYSMYLTHFAVIGVVAAQMVTPPVYTNFQMLYSFWSDFMCTLAVSTVLSLAFELPVIAIEKCLSRKNVKKAARP